MVVRTENREDGDDQSAVMEIDIADREEDEEYAGREMIFDDEVIAKFFGTDDFDIAQRYIVAGDGIIVDENMDTITISRTHDSGGGEISAGAGITVNDKTVSVNPDGISIQTRNGSTVADKKVQLAGFDNISSSRLDSSIGNDLLAQQESGDLAVVASLIGSGYAIRYKPMGTLGLVAEEGSGIKLTKESENNAN